MANNYMSDPEFMEALSQILGENNAPEEEDVVQKVARQRAARSAPMEAPSTQAEDVTKNYEYLNSLLGQQQAPIQVDNSVSGSNILDNIIGILGSSTGYALDSNLKPNYNPKYDTYVTPKSKLKQKDLLDVATKLVAPGKKPDKSFEERLEEALIKSSAIETARESRKEKKRVAQIPETRDAYFTDVEEILKQEDKDRWFADIKDFASDPKERVKIAAKIQTYLKKQGATKGMKASEVKELVNGYIDEVAAKQGYVKPVDQNKPSQAASNIVVVDIPNIGRRQIQKSQLPQARQKYKGLKVVK